MADVEQIDNNNEAAMPDPSLPTVSMSISGVSTPVTNVTTVVIGNHTNQSCLSLDGDTECLHTNSGNQNASQLLNGNMEQNLPADLEMFKDDPFMNMINQQQNLQQNKTQQQPLFVSQSPVKQEEETNSQSTDLNGSQTFNNTNMMSFGGHQSSPQISRDQSTMNESYPMQVQGNGVGIPTFADIKRMNGYSNDTTSEYNNIDKSLCLERTLTRDNNMENTLQMSPVTSVSSPENQQGSPSSAHSPSYTDMDMNQNTMMNSGPSYPDTNTQQSLVDRTESFRLDPNTMTNDNTASELMWPKMEKSGEVLNLESSNKHAKFQKMSNPDSISIGEKFDAAISNHEVEGFKFFKFGVNSDPPFQFGTDNGETSESSTVIPTVIGNDSFKAPQPPSRIMKIGEIQSRKRDQIRRTKEPILSQQFPHKVHGGYELRILVQPEEQHRARYLTEGSRGSVKNKSGQGYPVVKLLGHSGEATLQVFIGCDTGRVRPHGFYQACKVCGKNSTACQERDIDSTTVIEIDMKPENDMQASIDCVGILKLRNADVEQRIGIAKAKKKSTKARMIFRVTFQKPCGSPQVLQVASSPILCTQPVGQPEICKMSLKVSPTIGGDELFIIGKNFLRGTRVFFQEFTDDDNGEQIVWEKEGDIDKDFFQTTHLVVTVPEYQHSQLQTGSSAKCQVVVNSGGKYSDPAPFIYKQVDPPVEIKQETTPMDTSEESRKRNYPFVAPEALQLNQQIQQASKTSDIFQLPTGVIPGVMQSETSSHTPMEHSSIPQDGTGFQKPMESQSTEEGALRRDSFSLNQSKFGPEHLDTTPSQWNSSHEVLDNNSDNKLLTTVEIATDTDFKEVFPNVNFDSMTPMATNVIEQSLETRIKSPRLSIDTSFPPSQLGIAQSPDISRPNDTSIVSQFLQNVSDSLQSPNAISPSHLMNTTLNMDTNTILTQSGIHTISAAVLNASPPLTPKPSLLKEALTCSPADLEKIGQIPSLPLTPSLIPGDGGVDVMETHVMNVKNMMTTDNSLHNTTLLTTDNSLHNTTLMTTDNSLHNTTIDLTDTPDLLFSPEQVVPEKQPFSPSQVLTTVHQHADTSFNQEPPMMATSVSLPVFTYNNFINRLISGQDNQQQTLPTTLNNVTTSNTDLYLQMSSAQNIMSSGFNNTNLQNQQHIQQQISGLEQQKLTLSDLQLQQQQQQQLPTLPQEQQLATFSDLAQQQQQLSDQLQQDEHQKKVEFLKQQNKTLLEQVIQTSVLSQSLLTQSPPEQGFSLATPTISETCNTAHQSQAPPTPIHPAPMSTAHGSLIQQLLQQAPQIINPQLQQQQQQQQQQNQQQQQQLTGLPLLQQFTQAVSSGQGMTQNVTMATNSQPTMPALISPVITQLSLASTAPTSINTLATNVAATNVTATTPMPAQTPQGPQIIICNNPGARQGLPNTPAQFGAPSIVIMPGQGGPNNQVENLLKSILSSMIQQPQQQQTQQQVQQQPPQ